MSTASTLDLRGAVACAPLALVGVDKLTQVELAQAREHWRIHMAAEFASARVFAGIIPQMMRASLDSSMIREVADMVAQEMDHGVLSARVYAALGGDPRTPYLDLRDVPEHVEASPLEAVLRNVLSISCTGETLAVSVIGSEREWATDRQLHAILTRILGDEVNHARFGWKLAHDLIPTLPEEAKRRLSVYLVAIFMRDLRAMAGSLALPSVSDEALALGAPDGELSWRLYWDTTHKVTLPGLEALGLRAQWAFEKAKLQVLS